MSGLKIIQDCQKELVTIRNDELTVLSDRIYSHSCCLAAKSDILTTLPRICQRQQHRSNLHCSDPKEYFKVAILVPFLDHLISDLTERFSQHIQKVTRLRALLPTSITEASSLEDIKEAVDFLQW